MNNNMPQSILEMQAALQRKGEVGWRKRYEQNNIINDELNALREKNKYNMHHSEEKTSILESRKDDLDAASKQWRCRVKKWDADKLSVSGGMKQSNDSIPVNIPALGNFKKPPKTRSFRGKLGDSSSIPTSPEKNRHTKLRRSCSNPEPSYQIQHMRGSSSKVTTKKVPTIRPDDFTFTDFFKSIETKFDHLNEPEEIQLTDFDAVERQSLLVLRKDIKMQKRRVASKNPIKALAQRDDIKQEYTEIMIGAAERQTEKLKIDMLSKGFPHLAVEALAGLASKENFQSISLKKNSSRPSTLVPFKNTMLLLVKGRRHIQLRLVEPITDSINQGDCFLLVTPHALYNIVGSHSNIIEQAKAADIANHIKKHNDLGCGASKVTTVDLRNDKELSKHEKTFFKLLGDTEMKKIASAGNPSEDEIYESNITLVNMVYALKDDELVPLEEYWGRLPKYDMLTSTAVLVFDFGTEMYIWSGINADSDEKFNVMKLAKELWNEGFNYSECSVCPFNIALLLGERSSSELPKISNSRPEWALFCKLTQHRETILFKEKFLDWPDFSRTVVIKDEIINKKIELFYDIKPIDTNEMMKEVTLRSDIVIEGYRLARGDNYFDEETNRIFQFDTLKVTVWRIMENCYELVDDESIGQFYEGDSYIVKWNFSVSVKVRKLSGKPSKSDPGRNLTLFFFWIGCKSSINETGIAALLTVVLNNENAPQIRVTQGCEPPPFLQLFNGMMVIHKGKMGAMKKSARISKLFILRGEIEREAHLVEVPCKVEQLRSRASFLLLNCRRNEVTIWHGCKATGQTRKVLKNCVGALLRLRLTHLNLSTKPKLKELEEGNKDRYFNVTLGNTKNAYISLLEDQRTYNFTPRLFSFSSTSGTFSATEICCPHISEYPCPYPILQDQLYSSPQPALFLVDNEYELWLWQGWWYDKEGDGINTSDQTGSGAIRWQAERKAAMMTAKNYWIKKHGDSIKTNVKLVWAGLEPLEFQILFPHWEKREDVAEINIKEGKEPFGKKDLEEELAVFSRNIFPLSELQERPLPEGVDPTHLEDYLSPEDFQNVLSMTKEEYLKLPAWKQTSLKKENGLF